jgi:hypothetical protein
MTVVFPTIKVWFGTNYTTTGVFTLDDPVLGLLDGTGVLAGDAGSDITSSLTEFSIRRGRSTEFDDFSTGTLSASFTNWDRSLDALNAAGPYYGALNTGKQVDVQMYGVTLFSGRTEDWDTTWRVGDTPMAALSAEDELGSLARREFDAWTTTAGQTPGQRITDVLNRNEVAFGPRRDIDVGASTLQADNVTWGSNVLNYLQLVNRSELGRLFVSRDGTLTFRGRRSTVGATTVVTFRDDVGAVDTTAGTAFADITTTTGSRFQKNRVGVDREGGTLQTVGDLTAQQRDGIRALSITGLLVDDDSQSQNIASALMSLYANPKTRVSTITVDVTALTDIMRPIVAALDINNVIGYQWTPAATGSAVTDMLVIEGIDHHWSDGGPHIMTLSTTPLTTEAPFILDDPTWGVLDGPGRLVF